MTPLEDKVRKAFQAKADQVPVDVVPPLRLPARRRRFFSLAYGGGQRTGAPARRGWLAPAASAVLIVTVIAATVAVSRVMSGQQPGHRHGATATGLPAAVATSNQAAAWVAAQVSRSAVVSCDPVMCRALWAHGFPAYDLLVLQPGRAGPLESQVIVATATVRREFGDRLSSAYAPAVIASFGFGNARIDVRVIAPNGAAYLSELKTDLQARKANGTALLTSGSVVASAMARRQLAAGQVDSRLILVISFLTTLTTQVDVVAFGDSGPAASAGIPLRSATLAGSTASLQSILASLSKQGPPYRPSHAEITQRDGKPVLVIEYDAPSPLGLFASPGKGT
jgi:hypothetical protein